MKEEFQSKDIQKLLGIKKQRVEYLALKVPIKPEVEEVDRSGMVHKYSFRNVLQFAIAHTMNTNGIGIFYVRRVLDVLDGKQAAPPNGMILGDGSLFLISIATNKGKKYWENEFEKAIDEYYEPESEVRVWCRIGDFENDHGKRVRDLVFYAGKDEWYSSSPFTSITTLVNLNMIKDGVIEKIKDVFL